MIIRGRIFVLGGGLQEPPPPTGFMAKAIPSKESVTFSDAPIKLTNSMIDSNGEIHITGKQINSTDTYTHCIDGTGLTNRAKIFIEDCILKGVGMVVAFGYTRHDIVMKNNIIWGNDHLADSRSWGWWSLRANDPFSCIFENNYIERTGGVKLEFSKQNELSCAGYSIRYNKMMNVYQPNGLMNFVNIKGAMGSTVPNQRIEYNEIIGEPGKVWVEDTINIYTMKAPANSPAYIRHNFLNGAFKDITASQYSGGGFILDGKGENNTTDCCENWIIEDNIIVANANYCIGIALAINCVIRNNTCIVAAVFPDGSEYPSWTSGIWTDDYSSGDNVNFNLKVYGNSVGVVSQSGGRMDYGFYPLGQTHTEAYDNISIPGPITKDMEYAQRTVWDDKLGNLNLIMGPKVLI